MATKSGSVPVGSAAPDFTLTNGATGTAVKLSELQGSPVVLVFLRGFG